MLPHAAVTRPSMPRINQSSSIASPPWYASPLWLIQTSIGTPRSAMRWHMALNSAGVPWFGSGSYPRGVVPDLTGRFVTRLYPIPVYRPASNDRSHESACSRHVGALSHASPGPQCVLWTHPGGSS